MSLAAIFDQAKPVLNRLHTAGYEAYFVGGCVRDYLLGRPIHDIDITSSAYPVEIQKLFPKHVDLGVEHGTVLVLYNGGKYEVTTYRSEGPYTDYRRPDQVTFVKDLKEDLLRRDFTINALAMDAGGQVIDYFAGQADLQAGLIRAVGCPQERFSEDALRMMRALRFLSQLNFQLDDDTQNALVNLQHLLNKIAIERILVEMNKLWLGPAWQRALQLMYQSGLHQQLPSFDQLASGLAYLCQKVSHSVRFPNYQLAWALLIFSSQNHQQAGQNLGRQLSREWKMSNQDRQAILTYLDILYQRRDQEIWDVWSLYQLGYQPVLNVEELLAVSQTEGDHFGQAFSPSQLASLPVLAEQVPIASKKDMAIKGNDIIKHFDPQPRALIGTWLDQAEEAIVRGQLANEADQILAYIASLNS
ncbi:hypothetical protein AWM75_06845 [Aerococcus urinaehominis]|uniref:CCA-adding enzyme n=1 Tax=Aerococcus urinaehominis TaxID=128944 RepID=A0A0X8FLW6_9LACT|nr:CCA tRNA nucleotidyltransferase [Aerococcus urinaehominis]AMB99718.1 hypothetical protein AWM75_06845 [Aerococcus urinaehominis]SDL91781.1 tRNA nucleotidyltransferase (CCA-adding enzyme) [Aerococcus urinaehominis]